MQTRKMKRSISLLLALVFALSLMPLALAAESTTVPVEGYEVPYTQDANNGATTFSWTAAQVQAIIAKVTGQAGTITVTLVPNSGTVAGGNTKTVALNAVLPEPSVARAGYTLLGWYTDQSFVNKYDFSTPVTANFTLYALWEGAPVVTFNGITGDGTNKLLGTAANVPAPLTLANGETIPVSYFPGGANAPTRAGYTFRGWVTTNIAAYDPTVDSGHWANIATAMDSSLVTTATKIASPTTVYAVWDPIQYTVTAAGTPAGGISSTVPSSNSGTYRTAGREAGKFFYGEVIKLTTSVTAGYTVTGYTANGTAVTTLADGTTAVSGALGKLTGNTTFTYVVKGNTTLAVLNTNVYTISYSMYGGSVPNNAISSFTAGAAAINLPIPTSPHDDLIFAGWTADATWGGSNGTGITIVNTKSGGGAPDRSNPCALSTIAVADANAANLTLYPMWLKKTVASAANDAKFAVILMPGANDSSIKIEAGNAGTGATATAGAKVVWLTNTTDTDVAGGTLLNIATRTGYANTLKAGGTAGGSGSETGKWIESAATASTTTLGAVPDNAVVVVAPEWVPNQNDIYLHYEGGVDSSKPGDLYLKVDAGLTTKTGAVLPATTVDGPQKNGYYIEGWYTGKNGTGTKLATQGSTASGQSVATAATIPGSTNNTLNLYANWVAQKVTVTFTTNGTPGNQGTGEVLPAALDFFGGQSGTFPAATSTDKAFKAWHKSNNNTTAGDEVAGYAPADTNWFAANNYTATSAISLYAVFIGKEYTISYVENGGTWAANYLTKPTVYNNGVDPTMPTASNIQKAYYTLEGWYTDAALTTAFAYNHDANVTVYAKWSVDTSVAYEVKYNTNGGSSIPDLAIPQTAASFLVAQPEAPTKAGYLFKGWYKDAALNIAWNFETDTAKTDGTTTTLYAAWEQVLTIDLTTTGTNSNKLIISNSSAVSLYGALDNVVVNYLINGESKSKTFTKAQIKALADAAGVGNVTLAYNNDWVISLTAERGGSVSPAGINYVANGESLAITATADEGYAFDGWYKGTELVSEDATYTVSAVSADAAYSARFKAEPVAPATVTVSFDAGSGKGSYDDVAVAGDSLTITKAMANAFTRTGFKFVWFTDAADNKYEVGDVVAITGDTTLTAKYLRADGPANLSLSNTTKGVIRVRYSSLVGVDGYQVTVSTSKSFASGNGGSKTYAGYVKNEINKCAGVKLKVGTTYYVKVRSYTLDENGAKVWSNYSSTASIKLSK